MSQTLLYLGHGGTLRSVVEKAHRSFASRCALIEEQSAEDLPGKYTFLASFLYPEVMAIIQALITNELPVVVSFAFDNKAYNRVRPLLTAKDPSAGQGKRKSSFIPVFMDFKECIAAQREARRQKAYRPYGWIIGGIIVQSPVSARAIRNVRVGRPVANVSPRVSDILKESSDPQYLASRLWDYLVNWALDFADFTLFNVLNDFRRSSTVFSWRSFKLKYCKPAKGRQRRLRC